jgi:alpha-D-ribose 1-methylphosphonate 5-triphosphate synthase subunit PhnI
MAYVAVKGGQSAIETSIERLKKQRLKGESLLSVEAIEGGMTSLIDQVMSEGSLYSPGLAALAIKQAEGSPEEAVFLLRAYRSTLPRKHYSFLIKSQEMTIQRRISASFKDIPGGQILGTSTDYTHRLIDFELLNESEQSIKEWLVQYGKAELPDSSIGKVPKVIDYVRQMGLIKEFPVNDTEPVDVTKKSLNFPSTRSERLQILTRGQTGAVTALGYASIRGYGVLHPTVGELRVGNLPVSIPNPMGDQHDEDDCYYIGEVKVTEVECLIPVTVPLGQGKNEVRFEVGYGICFGQNETKAIAMSILDQALETGDPRYPTHNEEFVLMHVDSVEATGFISHLKLPHYVTFQSKLNSVKKTKKGDM